MGASYGKQKSAKAGKLNLGRFTALPHNVIHSQQYRALGYAARALLFDIAAQYNQSNNGKLVCCGKYLEPLNWVSNDTIARALKELKQHGLMIETRKGKKPPYSRAAWFAITWFSLDVREGLDIDPNHYRKTDFKPYVHVPRIKALIQKNTKPIYGVVRQTTEPINGVGEPLTTPINGAVEAINDTSPTPIYGEYIDLPSNYSIIQQHYLNEITQ